MDGFTAPGDRGLRRLASAPLSDSRFDLWILYHPDVRRVYRVRLFVDFITELIRSDLDLFEGRRPLEQAR